MLAEARTGVFAAIVAGFGGIISEVGAAMLVGGNIEGKTRILSTAIVLETRRGNFGLGLALGGVLLTMAFHRQFRPDAVGEWREVAYMSTPLYRLSDVRKDFSRDFDLHIPSLDIPGRGIFALLGPNGAGKSTMLRLLHFLEPALQGEIQFEGRKIGYPPELALRRRIAMVFQKPVMLSGSVRQNVLYGMRLRNRVDDEKLDVLFEELDLQHLADTPAKTISGGEAQRVALARALAVKPDVLLLDEPTANLDPYNIRLIEHIIKSAVEQDQHEHDPCYP